MCCNVRYFFYFWWFIYFYNWQLAICCLTTYLGPLFTFSGQLTYLFIYFHCMVVNLQINRKWTNTWMELTLINSMSVVVIEQPTVIVECLQLLMDCIAIRLWYHLKVPFISLSCFYNNWSDLWSWKKYQCIFSWKTQHNQWRI